MYLNAFFLTPRCPSCPESFHIEFLLDRHLQMQHCQKDSSISHKQKSPVNNNTLEYHHRYTSALMSKSSFYAKYYQPLQIDTIPVKQQSHFFQGLYESMNKSQKFLDNQPNYLSPDKLGGFVAFQNYSPRENFSPTSRNAVFSPSIGRYLAGHPDAPNLFDTSNKRSVPEAKMFSCGICERKDFSTQNEANTHQKIVHNMKTGVSLRCAYCNGDFRSR